MGADTPLGVFEEHVMLAVLRCRDEAYGMNVRRAIERLTDRSVAIGAVYSTLDRLEAKGFIASRRAVDAGLSRRNFTVTRPGARALAATRAMREKLWRGIQLDALLPGN